MLTRPIFIALCVAALSAAAFAQTPNPSPTSDDVVRISTNLIQVDVTVTDRDDRPITDLRPDEIEIYANGKKQKLTNFAFVSSGNKEVRLNAATKGAVTAPVASPSRPAAGSVRRTIAIVVDDLSMSWESVAYARDALKKLVAEQMQDGDMIALIRTGGSVGSLQQFTNDKRILNAAIERIKYNPGGTGGVSAMESISSSGTETLNQGMGPAPGLGAEVDQFLATAAAKRNGMIAGGTLGSLQFVINGMKTMPGRKSIMFFSDGFPLMDKMRDGTEYAGTTMENAHRVVEEANRAAVVIYSIDPRGLQVGLQQASDSTRNMTVRSLMAAQEARRDSFKTNQNVLNMLAVETGGFPTFNVSDLSRPMAKVLNDQSYYLVGYVPDSDTFDASSKFNKLEIKVLRKGAETRFRSGFYGASDVDKIAAPTINTSLGKADQLWQALKSPFAVNGITLRLTSLFGSSGDGELYVRSLLHIDGNDLKFSDEKDGSKSCSFEVLAGSFDANGEIGDQIAKTYNVKVPADIYKQMLADGIVYHFKFPAKKPGAYQYRVALRDPQTGKIGAANEFVQVPQIKGGGLDMSSIVLEDMSIGEFQQDLAGGPQVKTDPMRDTAVRRIKQGRVYRYSFEIYNPRLDANRMPDLETRIRVYREGKLITDGPARRFDPIGQTDMAHLRSFGGMAIGTEMVPGDYILQVIVIDKQDKQKRQVAARSIQFEVVG